MSRTQIFIKHNHITEKEVDEWLDKNEMGYKIQTSDVVAVDTTKGVTVLVDTPVAHRLIRAFWQIENDTVEEI